MTTAIVSLALALAAGIAAIAWLARRLEAALDSTIRTNKLYVDERDVADGYLHERDEALRQLAELDAVYRAAKMRIAQLQQEVTRATQMAAEQIAERIKKSGVADAARIVDELLATPLPGVSPVAPTQAGGDDRD